MIELKKSEEYHEDEGGVLFISFSRDENGVILGEPPEVYFGGGYIEVGFDYEKWTHYTADINWNSIFNQADPVNFPHVN